MTCRSYIKYPVGGEWREARCEIPPGLHGLHGARTYENGKDNPVTRRWATSNQAGKYSR